MGHPTDAKAHDGTWRRPESVAESQLETFTLRHPPDPHDRQVFPAGVVLDAELQPDSGTAFHQRLRAGTRNGRAQSIRGSERGRQLGGRRLWYASFGVRPPRAV